jgi:hypothetical protein
VEVCTLPANDDYQTAATSMAGRLRGVGLGLFPVNGPSHELRYKIERPAYCRCIDSGERASVPSWESQRAILGEMVGYTHRSGIRTLHHPHFTVILPKAQRLGPATAEITSTPLQE